LYQGLTEGLLLFAFLWFQQKYLVQNNRYRHGITGASFLMGYGLLRFMTEFAREPDVQLGFVLGSFSMGQVLCFIMIVSGAFVMNHVYKSQKIMGAK
jgi:phosphatidylglycerol:prolipoprotein diacylglycerol transferase